MMALLKTNRQPIVGVAALVVRQGRLLLGRRLNSVGAGTWAAPGGRLEYGESITDAALRELEEETGLQGENPHLLTATDDFVEGTHFVSLWVWIPDSRGEPRRCEPEKHAGWEWFPLDALPTPLFTPLRPSVLDRLRNLQPVAQ